MVMKKQSVLFLLGCALVITTACVGRMAKEQVRHEVKVLVEIRPEVNYVTHLYTLASATTQNSIAKVLWII